MNSENDYYAVLGILPDAEGVVIVAAYRALASLYHPDKWKGDVTESTRRMTDINVAYGVLSDPAKRKAYDATRKTSHSSFEAEDDQRDAAFDSALTELEVRWQVAVSIFPDLVDIRKRLAKTAHRLAFAFVTVMLETKQFPNRFALAAAMENEFLERHFGKNKKIIAFAKELIALGRKDAIVALNRYVDVLGSGVDPVTLIAKISNDFLTKNTQEEAHSQDDTQSENGRLLRLVANSKNAVIRFGRVDDSKYLATILGYDVTVIECGLFNPDTYRVLNKKTNEVVATLPSAKAYVEWTVRTLCT